MSKYWKTNSKIDSNLLKETINTIPSNTFYNLNQQKNVFTILEKLVYTITSFHLNRLNINSKYVDFGFVEKNTDLFIPFHDSNVQSISNLSLLSIVVFFDNNNNNPFLMVNLTEEKYKYKDFNEINISCSFPKKLNHVIFEPNKYYYSLHSEKILLINVFDKNNSDSIPFPEKLFASNHHFDFNKLSFEFQENEFKTILFKESKNGFNYDYFDECIYLDSFKY